MICGQDRRTLDTSCRRADRVDVLGREQRAPAADGGRGEPAVGGAGTPRDPTAVAAGRRWPLTPDSAATRPRAGRSPAPRLGARSGKQVTAMAAGSSSAVSRRTPRRARLADAARGPGRPAHQPSLVIASRGAPGAVFAGIARGIGSLAGRRWRCDRRLDRPPPRCVLGAAHAASDRRSPRREQGGRGHPGRARTGSSTAVRAQDRRAPSTAAQRRMSSVDRRHGGPTTPAEIEADIVRPGARSSPTTVARASSQAATCKAKADCAAGRRPRQRLCATDLTRGRPRPALRQAGRGVAAARRRGRARRSPAARRRSTSRR